MKPQAPQGSNPDFLQVHDQLPWSKEKDLALHAEEFRSREPLAVEKVGILATDDAGPSAYDDLLQSFRDIQCDLRGMEESP